VNTDPLAVVENPLRDADLSRGQGKWVLSVEDWAEIRRLHRAERMPIKVIARVLGCSKNTVRRRWPPGGGCGGASDSGVAAGLAEDAGHGNRGTD
jgi:DNA invertase Pin-like site-specific DNA recombinase